MSQVLRRIAGWLLTFGAVLGAVSLLLIAIGPLLGVRPLLFQSGSMSPAIETGDIAIARYVDSAELEVGDIVSVPTGQGDARVAHRIVDLRRDGSKASLTLRGDANETPDAQPHVVEGADRVVFVVPWAGHLVAAMTSHIGIFLSGLAAGGLLLLVVRGRRDDDRPAGGSGGGRRRRASRSAIVVTAAASMTIAGPAGAAAWTDEVRIDGTALVASTVAAPTLSCGALGLLSVTFTWTPVPGATSYTLHYGSGGGSTVQKSTTSHTVVSAISDGTAWVNANISYASTTWTSANSNTRTYTVAVASLCS